MFFLILIGVDNYHDIFNCYVELTVLRAFSLWLLLNTLHYIIYCQNE